MNKIESGEKLDFNNVLIRPKRSTIDSRSKVNLERTFKFRHSPLTWTGIPIIAANMDTTGTFEVYECLSKHKMLTALHKFYKVEDFEGKKLDPNFFMVSTGISDENFTNLCNILEKVECNWICIDIANGYLDSFVSFCKKVRRQFPSKIIVAGNVVTREMSEQLILDGGVDIVKAGIGGGSACTTRLKTGIGMPQLSCVIECSDACHGVKGHLISDGGITCPGDMVKAFGGGSDFVMMGGQFAGHDQSGGELVEIDGKKYKQFYGMSSDKAQETHFGKMEKYRSSEGRVLKIPYKGDLNDTVLDYLGGVRSACTYINAESVKQIPKCATFIRVNQQLNSIFT